MRSKTTQHTHLPRYQQRLQERKAILEHRATIEETHLRRTASYIAKEAPQLIKIEVLDKVSDANPLLGKLLSSVAGIETSPRQQEATSNTGEQPQSDIPFAGLLNKASSYLMPLIYSIGATKILSYSLRGAGALVRGGLRRFFGLRKK